jgi:hypothetical protein
MNPWIQGGMMGLGALSSLFAGDTEEEKLMKQRRQFGGQLWPQLMERFKANRPAIGSSQMGQMSSLFNQRIQPMVDRSSANVTQYGSWGAPETQRMFGRETLPLQAQFQGDLMQQNAQMTQQQQMLLMQLLGGMAR